MTKNGPLASPFSPYGVVKLELVKLSGYGAAMLQNPRGKPECQCGIVLHISNLARTWMALSLFASDTHVAIDKHHLCSVPSALARLWSALLRLQQPQHYPVGMLIQRRERLACMLAGCTVIQKDH